MDTLTIDGEVYLSSKRAAKVTGYAKDYVGQLCREGLVEGRLVGRGWYVREQSIREHRFGKEKPANTQDKKSDEPTKKETSVSSVHYTAEKITPLPRINEALPQEVERARESSTPQPKETHHIAAMQQAWQEWFSKVQTNIQDEDAVPISVKQIHNELPTHSERPVLEHRKMDVGRVSKKEVRTPQNATEGIRRYTRGSRIHSHIARTINILFMLAALGAFLVVAANFIYKSNENGTTFITGTHIYTAK